MTWVWLVVGLHVAAGLGAFALAKRTFREAFAGVPRYAQAVIALGFMAGIWLVVPLALVALWCLALDVVTRRWRRLGLLRPEPGG